MGKLASVIGFFGTIFILFVLAILLISSVRIINAGEVGVKLEFGRVMDVLEPNIHFVVPVMNDVKYLSTQIEKFETTASAASNDLQVVETQLAVNYRINGNNDQIMNLYETFRGNHEVRIIDPLVQEVVKANTAQFNAAELITKRVELKSKIAQDLKQKLGNYGIDVVEVSITNLDFSPEFNAAIEAKVVAEQKLQKEKIDLETKKIEVQRLIAETNASATSLVIQANADAEAKIIRATAEAEAIEKITKAVTAQYIQYNYVQRWDGQLPKVMGSQDVIIGLESLDGNQEANSS
ncbi:prohibitin family protein [Candidatus Micrarchaeota archaeon]|nr:prohibitin family protein [Candidatus Micrarchaeota archaeon]